MGCCCGKVRVVEIVETEIIVDHCTMREKNPHKIDIFSNDKKRYRLHCESWIERCVLYHRLKKNTIIKFDSADTKIVGSIEIIKN